MQPPPASGPQPRRGRFGFALAIAAVVGVAVGCGGYFALQSLLPSAAPEEGTLASVPEQCHLDEADYQLDDDSIVLLDDRSDDYFGNRSFANFGCAIITLTGDPGVWHEFREELAMTFSADNVRLGEYFASYSPDTLSFRIEAAS